MLPLRWLMLHQLVIGSIAIIIICISGVLSSSDTDDMLWKLSEYNWRLLPGEGLRHGKYSKLARSPMRFLRGCNYLWWSDNEVISSLKKYGGTNDTELWAVGDMHVHNFGTLHHRRYASSSIDGLLYCVDDFDEAIFADYQYDVMRLASSVLLFLRSEKLEYSHKHVIRQLALAYVTEMRKQSFGGRITRESTKELIAIQLESAESKYLRTFMVEMERTCSQSKLLEKWAPLVRGETRVFNHKELVILSPVERIELDEAMEYYVSSLLKPLKNNTDTGFFSIKSAARRLGAGTGSFGLMLLYVLVEGSTTSPDDDIILEFKEQRQPAGFESLTPTVRHAMVKSFVHPAARVAIAERALSFRDDPFLGFTWLSFSNHMSPISFSVHELSPYKKSYPVDIKSQAKFSTPLKLRKKADAISIAKEWGKALAKSHARSGQLYGLNVEAMVKDPKGFSNNVWKVVDRFIAKLLRSYDNFRKLGECVGDGDASRCSWPDEF